jgi:hypothetical protein
MSVGQFAQNLLSLGEGKLPVNPSNGLIKLQNTLWCTVRATEEFKNTSFAKNTSSFHGPQQAL